VHRNYILSIFRPVDIGHEQVMHYFRSAYNFKEIERGKIKEEERYWNVRFRVENIERRTWVPDYIIGKPLQIRFRIRYNLKKQSVYAVAAWNWTSLRVIPPPTVRRKVGRQSKCIRNDWVFHESRAIANLYWPVKRRS